MRTPARVMVGLLTPEEMVDVLTSIKGRRRFQGFGKHFATDTKQEEQVRAIPDDTPKKLGPVAGGSGKSKERVTCDDRGAGMRRVGIALSEEEAKAWASHHIIYR